MVRKGQTDELWDAVEAEFYPKGAPKHPKTLRTEINGWVECIRDQGGKPDELAVRKRQYRIAYPKLPWTLKSLARHWSELAPPRPRRKTRDELDHEEGQRKLALQQRRTAFGRTIVSRHSEAECQAAWDRYLEDFPVDNYERRYLIKMDKALSDTMADLLEPGELDRMMKA